MHLRGPVGETLPSRAAIRMPVGDALRLGS